MTESFRNDDLVLSQRAEAALAERRRLGLEGLVGDLEAVVINVEPDRLLAAAGEFLATTGHGLEAAFVDQSGPCLVLGLSGSARLVIRSRKGESPWDSVATGPKASRLPRTRLEANVFGVRDMEAFVAAQRARGTRFLSEEPVQLEQGVFIQTVPSPYTGESTGFVEWTGRAGEFHRAGAEMLETGVGKPADRPWLATVGRLDHTASRVRAEHRDDAIIEFMGLTNHDFAFAVHVDSLNSITNVARRGEGDFAKVFTSGIIPFGGPESGPTEAFIHNYGPRAHHLAFETRDIVRTVAALEAAGQRFISALVGSPEEGLRQTFTAMHPSTFLVNEYIERYDGFDGFFTLSNVTLLTRATVGQ